MSSPLYETIGLIASSGFVSSLVTFLASHKMQKTDISQKTIDFWQNKADDYLDRLDQLDQKFEALEKLKCEKQNCEKRI